MKMQSVTGRLTADATIRTTGGGKEVVSFSIADNESYKPKGKDEPVQISTFFNCSYWLSTGVAAVLRKGTVVQITGRISARPYQTNTGDNAASLDINAKRIEVLAYADKKTGNTAVEGKPAKSSKAGKAKAAVKPEQDDDLPF